MSPIPPEQLYETDFYAWTRAQAKKLRRFARTRPDLPLDLAHIAEEIQDLGKGERDAVFDLAERIVGHFLLATNWPGVPDRRLQWLDEVDEFRTLLEQKLTPTIRRDLEAAFDDLYVKARRNVARKMRRHGEEAAAAALPADRPYTLEQVLGDWEPEAAGTRAAVDDPPRRSGP